MPKTRVQFWENKFDKNVVRDQRNQSALKDLGWRVLVIWECETKEHEALRTRISTYLGGKPRARVNGEDEEDPRPRGLKKQQRERQSKKSNPDLDKTGDGLGPTSVVPVIDLFSGPGGLAEGFSAHS